MGSAGEGWAGPAGRGVIRSGHWQDLLVGDTLGLWGGGQVGPGRRQT